MKKKDMVIPKSSLSLMAAIRIIYIVVVPSIYYT